jgi:hypothetical protein
MIEHEAADNYPPAPNLARKVADLAASIEAKDAEIERLQAKVKSQDTLLLQKINEYVELERRLG